MKEKLFYLLPLLALASCGEPSYKDASLSPERRAELLVKELTLEEKAHLMMDGSRSVERLGIKPYNWWNEALHGVARAGLATVFPQPIGMAASFNPEMVYEVFNAVSDEARAKNTYYASQDSRERYQGLTMWTPTVNIYRDPRWGRGIETYGEDPYLTSRMGVMVVKGLQGPADGKYDKLHACAKHFAVHSGPEWNRHSFNAENIKPRDLYETYLPPFEALVKEGKVEEVMCAYNRFEGDPCCGSDRLLMQILRGEWGFNGIVVSDCGAIADFYNDRGHHTHPDAESASAAAVISGTDLECGSSYKALIESVKKGLISEETVDTSVKRLMKARFALGEMDEPEKVSWTKIPFSVVASAAHDSLALNMARESMTLLMNKDNFLPLKRGGLTVAVMGPNANDSVMQWGNYNGMPAHTVTILDGVRNLLGTDDKLIYEQGCPWVERTLIQSAFSQCKSDQGPGFTARYWNNLKREGEPVTTTQVTTPFRFCTSGATVFAPGVNLTDFSATYNSAFIPKESGEIVLEVYCYGSGRLRVNGEEVKSFSNKHGARKSTHAMKVQAGKSYDLELDFEYLRSDAQLNFDLGFKKDVDIRKSVERVKDADIVIFASGISPSLEGEEMGVNLPGFKKGDRTDIELPAVQRELIDALHRAGKKIILVNCSGSPIGLEPETQKCEAILQAWYPGQQGGKAVAEVLFGDYNPAGKLPVTFYRNVSQLPDFEDYNMTGRTYRYMQDVPLFPFGYGLSYTTFGYGKTVLDKNELTAGQSLKLTVPVTNTGKRNGEEVVQVYLRKQGDAEGPIKTLRAFKRVSIPAGKTVNVEFDLKDKELEWWDDQSNTVRVCPGNYDIMVGGSSKEEDLQRTTIAIK
ncbi:xylan 1,4-beta-xylosidase [Bacteroides cellulosilyticus]|uniref:Glycoside hydrolase family 3 protein n=1 Tax=Bacteroides cellulosilyticus TaxID=246787 RepID=A0A6L3JYZ6_9BACE|nr:xylan 1,4-beta-xylosidase [Bacteroides cellulosilyticus]KAA5417649.1 glycoside hydrolase family 3 protein [Bacteroides cellulosilyticus]MDC7176526.1 glycoside hydrolase family 3 C-terminal domain-containing protein [Bacteroides cellulosilyticus]MDC7180501.1 glycoside hydrolase family 3 C-terminal domain-containing protein [Bacteroides cellulosilyticus]